MNTPSATAMIDFYEDTGVDEVSRQARQELKGLHKLSKRSISLAITALEKMAKPLHIEANLHKTYNANHPAAINAYKMVENIEKAIEELKGLQS